MKSRVERITDGYRCEGRRHGIVASIEERPVPQRGAVKGEVLAKTQPFPRECRRSLRRAFHPPTPGASPFVDKWLGKRKIDEFRPGVHAHKPQGHDLLSSFVRGTARRTWYRGGRLDTWDSVVAYKLKR
jgi:hypothetical protein